MYRVFTKNSMRIVGQNKRECLALALVLALVHRRFGLLGECETQSLLAKVEDGVVFSEEDVTQNPKWAAWSGDINSGHAKEADGLAERGDLENIVFGGQREALSGNTKLDVGHRGQLAAVDGEFIRIKIGVAPII